MLNQGLHFQTEALDGDFFFPPDFAVLTSVMAEACRPE